VHNSSDVLSLTVKDFLVPGSTMFILVGVAIGVAMLYARPPLAAWGRRWLVTLAVMYLVLSLPLTSDALFAGLNRGYRPLQPEAANGASTIVILSEGIQVRRSGGMSLDTLNLPTAFCALSIARGSRWERLYVVITTLTPGMEPDYKPQINTD